MHFTCPLIKFKSGGENLATRLSIFSFLSILCLAMMVVKAKFGTLFNKFPLLFFCHIIPMVLESTPMMPHDTMNASGHKKTSQNKSTGKYLAENE